MAVVVQDYIEAIRRGKRLIDQQGGEGLDSGRWSQEALLLTQLINLFHHDREFGQKAIERIHELYKQGLMP